MKKGIILSVASLMCLTSLIGCDQKGSSNSSNSSGEPSSSSIAPSSSSSTSNPSTSSSTPASSSSSSNPSSSSSQSSAVPVTTVQVGPSRVTLYLDDEDPTRTLNLIVLPQNATNKEVIWSSSKEDVATVDQNGKVTAKSLGEVLIRVSTFDGKSADIIVVVE